MMLLNLAKLSFAICIDIAVTIQLPKSFKVQIENCAPHEIHIDIPWQPRKCVLCKTYGHSDYTCSLQPREEKKEEMKSKPKFDWREVPKRKDCPSSDPCISENTPSPITGKGKEKASNFSSSLVVSTFKGSSLDSSATKKVCFYKTKLLLKKV